MQNILNIAGTIIGLYLLGFAIAYYLIKLYWMKFLRVRKWTDYQARQARIKALTSWLCALVIIIAICISIVKMVRKAWFVVILPLSLLVSCNNRFYGNKSVRKCFVLTDSTKQFCVNK